MNTYYSRLLVAALCIALLTGCAAKNSQLTTTQQLKLSTAQSIAFTATLNSEAETIAEQLSASHLLNDHLVKDILLYSRSVDAALKAALVAEKSGQPAEMKTAEILSELSRVKQLPQSVQDFVGSSQNQHEIVALVSLINAVYSSVRTIAGA